MPVVASLAPPLGGAAPNQLPPASTVGLDDIVGSFNTSAAGPRGLTLRQIVALVAASLGGTLPTPSSSSVTFFDGTVAAFFDGTPITFSS